MRIAMVTRSFWPKRAGMEFVVHDLSNALADLGHEVHVFAPRVKGAPAEGPPDHRYRFAPFGIGRQSKANLPLLAGSFLRRGRFDVINAHSAGGAARYAHALKRLFRVPVVVTCHGEDVLRVAEVGYGRRLDPADDRTIRDHLRRADAVVAISGVMGDALAPIVGESEIARITNGVCKNGAQPASSGPIRKQLGGECRVILSVGRNVPVKRFDAALRVFAHVARSFPAAHYVHIGREGEALSSLAQELGVAARFHALGELDRDQVHHCYGESDVFLHTSAMESFGLVTSEAMAAGLACVVSDAGANGEAVVSGETGYVVPPEDERGMAEAVLDLLRDEPKRRAFGDAGRRHIEGRQSWPAVAAEYVRLFERVAGAAAGGVAG